MQEFPVYKKLFVKTSRVSSIQETFARKKAAAFGMNARGQQL